MPGKNWTLQYCEHQETSAGTATNSSAAPVKQSSPTTAIALPAPLVPPDPESRFDFRRLQIPKDKHGKMIVLKGALKEDGTVDALQVYQGVAPEMDEAARLAFSRWKFKPAMRAAKPIALDILVGITPEGSTVPSVP
jgi:outer membrane biosynthesis protein TonB